MQQNTQILTPRLITLLAKTLATATVVFSLQSLSHAETVQEPVQDLSAKVKVIHVYADEKGESHLEVLTLAPNAKPIPGTTVIANAYKPATVDWHVAPRRLFTINMSGSLEAEVSDGTKYPIGPGDLVFMNDLHGKGHITHIHGPITNLFIEVPDDFDFYGWVNGE
jgi:hypothetical protein